MATWRAMCAEGASCGWCGGAASRRRPLFFGEHMSCTVEKNRLDELVSTGEEVTTRRLARALGKTERSVRHLLARLREAYRQGWARLLAPLDEEQTT